MRLIGEGSIVIHSTAEFKCSSIGNEKIFGIMILFPKISFIVESPHSYIQR